MSDVSESESTNWTCITVTVSKEPQSSSWASDTANAPGCMHPRAWKLVEDVKTAGENAVPMLIDALLNDPDVTVREKAANHLRFQENDQRIGNALLQVLENSDEHPFVKEMAAEAVSNYPTQHTIRVLLKCASDTSPEVRYWSIQSLGLIGRKSLINRLRMIAKRDKSVIQDYGSISSVALKSIHSIKEDYPMCKSSKAARRRNIS